MIKYRVFLDFEKEEDWLMEMARKGQFLSSKDFLGGYHFDSREPKEAVYQIDYRKFPNREEFENYCNFFLGHWLEACRGECELWRALFPQG